MNAAVPELTIWYDATCPLCAQEMHVLQRHAGVDRLRLIDCSSAAFADAEVAAGGYTRSELMRLIHARDDAGHWLRGVAVFERAYGMAGIPGAARLFGNPWLRPLWDLVYPWVARHRMRLSRFGLPWAYGRLIGFLARRAARSAQACTAVRCGSRTQ